MEKETFGESVARHFHCLFVEPVTVINVIFKHYANSYTIGKEDRG